MFFSGSNASPVTQPSQRSDSTQLGKVTHFKSFLMGSCYINLTRRVLKELGNDMKAPASGCQSRGYYYKVSRRKFLHLEIWIGSTQSRLVCFIVKACPCQNWVNLRPQLF